MKKLQLFSSIFLMICIVINLFIDPNTHVEAMENPTSALTSPDELLNPDGSLNLDGNFNGSLDLEGWDVHMDPHRGPVFLPKSSTGEWSSLGEGGGPISGNVYAIAIDGTDVYVGGHFTNADNNPAADYIARWDGNTWHALGNNGSGDGSINSPILEIMVYSKSSPGIPAVIIAGGNFIDVNNNGTTLSAADYIARWDGTNWSSLAYGENGNGSLNSYVNTIAIDGDDIYVGGMFTNVNNKGTTQNAADYFARYSDGNDAWYAIGSKANGDGVLNSFVYDIGINDTGIYIGGAFTNANDLPAADYVAHWNWGSNTWEALGSNGSGNGAINNGDADGYINAIVVTGSGALTKIYVGGQFYDVVNSGTSLNANNLAVFGGTNWSRVTSPSPYFNGAINDIVVSGNSIYVAGGFTNLNGITEADHIASVSAGVWSGLGSNGSGNGSFTNLTGNAAIITIAVDGLNIYAGGSFDGVNNNGTIQPASTNVAYFGIFGAWMPLGDQLGSIQNYAHGGSYNEINSIATYGNDIYFGGTFGSVNNNGLNNIYDVGDNLIKWDGTEFLTVEQGNATDPSLNNTVRAIAVSPQGNVYAGGDFFNAANKAYHIAVWNGFEWQPLIDETGDTTGLNGNVFVLKFGPDGNLYVGGNFTDAGGNPAADYIAKWNVSSSTWQSLGSGVCGGMTCGSISGPIFAIEFMGTDLYAGGSFYDLQNGANIIPEADNIAKWNGSIWSALGSNGILDDGALQSGAVNALAVAGSNLYVGGTFTNAAGDNNIDHIARWDGNAWNAIGGDQDINNPIQSIAVQEVLPGLYDLYLGGSFTNAGGVAEADYIAKYDHLGNWAALGHNGAGDGSIPNAHNHPTFTTSVNTLVIKDSDLIIGGSFFNVSNNGTTLKKATYIAVYGLEPEAVPPLVTSITRASTSPTTASSVDFTVTFSEDVTGVDANGSDFALTASSGLPSAAITGVTPVSDSVYTVSVNTGSGSGTLRIDIPNTATIKDIVGNDLSGLPIITGESYIKTSAITLRSTGTNDGWLLESTETSGAGGAMNSTATTLYLGDDASDKQYRAILHFDTSSLPDTAIITSAILQLKKQGLSGTNPFDILGALRVDARKPAFGAITLELADFRLAAGRNNIASFNITPVNNWYSGTFSGPGRNYINKTGTTQFKVYFTTDDNDDNGIDIIKFFSGNAAAGARPKLVIQYYVP